MLLLAALRDQQLATGHLTAEKNLDPPAIDDLIAAIEQFLARSPSVLMMVNLGDMLAETAQINVPGTTSEHPNWRHRFRLAVNDLSHDPLVQRIAQAMAAERHEDTAAVPIASVGTAVTVRIAD